MSAKHMVLGKTLDANARQTNREEMLTIWSLFLTPYSFWGRWTRAFKTRVTPRVRGKFFLYNALRNSLGSFGFYSCLAYHRENLQAFQNITRIM
jgi:hypothetical protein